MSDKLEYPSLSALIDQALAKAAQEAEEGNAAVNQALEKVVQEAQSKCDHGVEFDQAEAEKMRQAGGSYDTGDPAVDFIMGSPASAEIRKRYPRLDGKCPKGCGYVGIAYASFAHMLYGDW